MLRVTLSPGGVMEDGKKIKIGLKSKIINTLLHKEMKRFFSGHWEVFSVESNSEICLSLLLSLGVSWS